MTYTSPEPVGAQWQAPPLPPAPRQSNAVAYVLFAVGLVIIALTVTLIVAQNNKSDDSLAGYNQDPVSVAKKLHTCDSPQRFGKTTVRCVMPDGNNVSITTSTTSGEQDYLVAIIKDTDAGQCVAVLNGVVIAAQTESTLTEAIGIPESFVNKHGGYLLCPV